MKLRLVEGSIFGIFLVALQEHSGHCLLLDFPKKIFVLRLRFLHGFRVRLVVKKYAARHGRLVFGKHRGATRRVLADVLPGWCLFTITGQLYGSRKIDLHEFGV